jgi:hypothetical protein
VAQRDLTVHIIGDSRSLERAFNRSAAAGKGFQAQMAGVQRSTRRIAAGAGIAIGVQALVRRFNDATAAASNLNEQTSRANVVFGRSAAAIQRWSRTTTDSFGISRRAALEAASGFGQILQTSGLTEEASARMSRALVELAGDMASFNNISTDEALLKLRSGLAGEAEPLRVLGVQLSETRVQAEAYASGIANVGEKLTDAQKVQARYRIILQDTAKQQGDSERTAGSLANKQRRLNASVEDLNASLGQLGTRVLPPVIDGLIALSDATVGAIDGVGRLRDRILSLDIDDPTEGFFVGLGRTLANIGDAPGLKQLRDRFVDVRDAGKSAIDTMQEFNFTATGLLTGQAADALRRVSTATTARPPAFGEPGFKPGGAPPVPLGPDAEQRNRIFNEQLQRRLEVVQDIPSLQGQLAALDRIAEFIDQQIAKVKDVTRKLNLRDELMAVRRQQAGIRQQISDDFLDRLQLGVDRATLTTSLRDDLAALDALEAGVRQQIASQGRTLALERQLLDIARQRAAIAEQQRQADIDARERAEEARKRAQEAERAARQARQFRTLGLTAEGDEPTAGVGALRRRLGQITERIQGTALDTNKTRAQLRRIAKVLSGQFGAVGKEVRAAIDQMFDDIAAGLDQGGKRKGPLTKFRVADANDILGGLGLSPDEVRRLSGRLSKVGVGGTVSAGGTGAFGRPVEGTQQGGITITGPVTVVANDPAELQRGLQKKARRRATQTTGPNAGNSMGTTR